MDDSILNAEKRSGEFLSPEAYAQLKEELSEFSGEPDYEALDRYYLAANEAAEVADKLVSVKLLQHSFDSLFHKRATAPSDIAEQILLGLDRYTSKLGATTTMLSAVAESVPKIMHFVWVGGSEVGNIQRDYMNIWRKVLAPQGYTFNLWYDRDALLAFEMNRVILDSARAHAMESGGDKETNPQALSRLIEDRARVLKWQMSDYLRQPQWAGRADEARIDLMVRAYGKDRTVLEAFRQQCLDTHLAMVGPDLRLRDAGQEFSEHFLRDVYQREVGMRGNFAAASDVVRLQAEDLEGGRYSDMDYLPPLAEKLGGVDISSLDTSARIGVLQLLLNHDDSLMPGRDRQRYADSVDKIPAEHQEALLAFALGKPGVREIFVPPQESSVAQNGFRMGTAYGARDRGEMNAHFLAHPGSGMTQAIMQTIRFNYDCLHEVERRLANAGIAWGDMRESANLIQNFINERTAEGRLTQSQLNASAALSIAMLTYYQDGIRIGARGTIDLTGPGAAVTGLSNYTETHLQFEHLADIRARLKLTEGYNVFTEEEMISGWTVNGTPDEWLAKEQEKWTSAKLKSRYAANLGELLKEQTLAFERGWPVVEGKPVLLTSVLQSLLNDLGEPFIRAMNDRLSGDVLFNKAVSIGFDERQQIIAQPASELPPSIGAELLGNLNEALTRIAVGKLPVEQLSPLHRVVLGSLFGAQALDEKGFANAWDKARSFAESTQDRGVAARYEHIEQTYRQQRSAAFDAGLDAHSGGVSLTERSAALKVLAFAEPLSERQWGTRIAQIEARAIVEYRSAILQRGNSVRELMFQANATSARQLPQDLLVRGGGEPGRRCYPLALVMAAALEQGRGALRTLIGRLASANVAVEDPTTQRLLLTLDDLRSVPMADFAIKRGAVSLASAIQMLETKTASASMMLNTDNHSLLIAKVVEQGSATWHFYDPNFGLYGFDQVADLQRGIERFLADGELARHYGIVDVTSDTFNLIELDGQKIATLPLPSEGRVGQLLDGFDGTSVVEPWQHHAALRARALSENARLGRGVAELEGLGWARVIESVTQKMISDNTLKPGFVPVYETVQPTVEGQWSVALINSKRPEEVEHVTVDEPRLIKIKGWLRQRFEALDNTPKDGVPHEPGAVNTMNSGFAILALMQSLRQAEGSLAEGAGTPMTLGVRLHSYVIYSQVLHGVVADIYGLIKLVQVALLDEKLIAATSSTLLGRTFGRLLGVGAGNLLALVNVGFDIYELVTADNPSARAAIAVQLSFDATGLALGLVATGSGTLASVAGPLAVVVGGIAYGVGALAHNYLINLYRAQQVGAYFYRMKSLVADGGWTVESGVFQPAPEVVFRLVDLRALRGILGSHLLLRGQRSGPGLPNLVGDTSQAIDINQRWGLSGHSLLPDDIKTLILPCTPQCAYGYDYQLMPGATHRHDLGFDELRELEHDSQGTRTFWFDPWTPFEYVMYALYPKYQPTLVEILLANQCRTLYVPHMPEEYQGQMSYLIGGSQGQYSLSLNPGVVAIELTALGEPASVQWLLRAIWTSDASVLFDAQGLILGGIRVKAPVDSVLDLELEQGRLFRVNWSSRQLELVQEQLPDNSDASEVARYLTHLNREHRLVIPCVPLHNFKVPFSDPQWPTYTNGFYETSRERILYARDLPGGACAQIQLAAVRGDQVYFYHRDYPTVWRVDAISGKVNRRYRLFNPRMAPLILSCQDVGEAIHVVQQVSDMHGVIYQFDYLLYPDEVDLKAITHTLSEASATIAQGFDWQGWSAFEKQFDSSDSVYDDSSLEMGGDITQWTVAFLSLQAHRGTQTLRGWVRLWDEWYVSDLELGLVTPTLLAPREMDGDSLVFFDAQARTLSRWVRRPGPMNGVLHTLLSDVDSVVAAGDTYLAQTHHGLVFEVSAEQVVLRSVNEQWLMAQDDWLAGLPVVAGQHGVSGFEIVGLSDVGGASLAARYLEGRILLVGAEQGRKMHAVSLSHDKQALWLFAPDSGRLYRQPLLTLEQMRGLFGSGKQRVRRDEASVWQGRWRQWLFAGVTAQGSGLRGVTRDGVILELIEGQPARVTGVEQLFFDEFNTASLRKQKLAKLLARLAHATFLTTGQVGDICSWYDTQIRRRFFTTLSEFVPRAEYLGLQKGANPLLHNQHPGLLFSNRSNDWWGHTHDYWAKVTAALRDGEVLTIEGRGKIVDLLPLIPDGVTTLVLGYAQGLLECHVSPEAWMRLDCLIVDLAQLKSGIHQLSLGIAITDHWLITMVDGHLLLIDSSDGRCLLFHGAEALDAASRHGLELAMEFSGERVSLSPAELMVGLEPGVNAPLLDRLDKANEV
ncbi:TcdA/TcdB pore-forming domain-containing protein [Pseudomonas sp. RA_35y_Pfl2_P32]|uniref:TcdA/TcdB pore-forming domain-containing protein n=1 Tax=Pseudomonas sp. RA_35y_Pfl2_P32 TaxID=3088705 RepID=UPI0030DCB59D